MSTNRHKQTTNNISRQLDEIDLIELRQELNKTQKGKRGIISTTQLKKLCRDNNLKIGGKNADRLKRIISHKLALAELSSEVWVNLGIEHLRYDELLKHTLVEKEGRKMVSYQVGHFSKEQLIRAGVKSGESLPLVSLQYQDKNGNLKALNDNHKTRYEPSNGVHDYDNRRVEVECYYRYKHINQLRTMDILSICVKPAYLNESPLPKLWKDEKYTTTVCLPMVAQNQGLVLAGKQNNSKGVDNPNKPKYAHWRVGKIQNQRSEFTYNSKTTATAFRNAIVELKLFVNGRQQKTTQGRIIPVVYECFGTSEMYNLGWAIFHDVNGVISRD